MAYQNISATVSTADLEAIKQAIDTISAKLPFLIALSKDEKKKLYKMGAKSIDFVNDCQVVAQNYPEIFPVGFNREEFEKDAKLVVSLSEISILLNTLNEKISDTSIAVGSEAMNTSLEVYEYVKTAAKRKPGLKSVAEQLKQRFKEQGKKTK
ncbi:MAG: hypothetical protein OHK0057_27250 [Thermoflexibacter sp.]